VSSRPHADGAAIIVRRRHCMTCPHRFNTQESTLDVVKIRVARRARQAKWKDGLGETYRERDRDQKRRQKHVTAARAEASETGRPLPEILKAWGIAPPSA
jgi:transcriptional regulator NrdR family protein